MSIRDSYNKYTQIGWDKWEPYFAVYDQFFEKYRNNSPVFMEVGVARGGSIKAWVDYFGPGAKIYGSDISPKVTTIDGATILIGDQSSTEFWDNTLQITGEFDCFLDDGGHTMEQQIVTFLKVWPKIKQGGVYICEDTHTSYMPETFNGGYKKYTTFIEFAKNLIDCLHIAHIQTGHDLSPVMLEVSKDIGQIVFHDSMVIFIKGKPPFNRIMT